MECDNDNTFVKIRSVEAEMQGFEKKMEDLKEGEWVLFGR